MAQSTFASLPFSTETFKFNLELTAAELALIENALGQVNRNQEALPLLERVRYLRTLPGTSQGLPLIHDSMNDIDDLTSLNSHAADSSSEDDAFLAAVEKSFTYCHKFSASVEDFFRESLASDDDEEAIDETSLDTEATNEDYDSYLDNSNDDIEPNGRSHQHRVASRKLHQLNQHPYAPPGGPIPPEDVINARPPCPRNGRRLRAAQMWQAQATSIQSASFITSDALIATLATPHAESTASHLDVRVWVDNAVSYLKQQEGIQLGVCSIEAMIARSMITYMQLAMQCQSIITASEEYSNIRQLYNKEVAKLENAPSERTFHRWSFYVLVIIAGLEIRWKVASMAFHVLRQVGNMLRQPGNGDEADLVTRRIIPTIAWIRSQMPISLQRVFSLFISDKSWGRGLPGLNFALPARDTVAWGVFKSDVTEQMLVIGGKGINGLLQSLMCCPGGVKHLSVTVIKIMTWKENAIWTENERVNAEAGEVVRDLDDLSEKWSH
ncbi:hypothetical protein DFH29DRAFT_873092 [Suillus ampliporus]|nr:hypothetical protein DFH29DRAFT_873092 [Suillus ampliporus]